jgi:sugar transferase (PEP-CTERM/EpsH1 system associated)
MANMNVLWVKLGGLWPLNTGGRLRSFNLVKELSQRHRVTVLTTHGPGEDADGLAEHLPDCEEVLSLPYALPKHGSTRFAAALMRSWFSAYPVDLWKARVRALTNEVARRIAAGSVDICIADFLTATPNVPLGNGVPVVLFEHNVEHVIWQRLSQHEERLWRRMLLQIESSKMRRAEADACRRADLTLAVSDTDRSRLQELAPAANIATIPTGVDTAYFAPDGAPASDHSLVFTGSLDWYPNEDAMLYFFGQILPSIRAAVPDATVTVVGRNPGVRLKTAAAETAGVSLTGTVPDVRPYVRDAAVFVVPLRIGSGTRLKIFEALAMGKAVVSTTVGAEGLGLIPGVHFLQADTPNDFADAVISLTRDPARRNALGKAGRELVERHYSWSAVSRTFDAHFEELRA